MIKIGYPRYFLFSAVSRTLEILLDKMIISIQIYHMF